MVDNAGGGGAARCMLVLLGALAVQAAAQATTGSIPAARVTRGSPADEATFTERPAPQDTTVARPPTTSSLRNDCTERILTGLPESLNMKISDMRKMAKANNGVFSELVPYITRDITEMPAYHDVSTMNIRYVADNTPGEHEIIVTLDSEDGPACFLYPLYIGEFSVCEALNPCHPSAVCEDVGREVSPLGYVCNCPPKTRPRDRTKPPSEMVQSDMVCVSICEDVSCGKNAECVITEDNQPQCRCRAGFEGNELTYCVAMELELIGPAVMRIFQHEHYPELGAQPAQPDELEHRLQFQYSSPMLTSSVKEVGTYHVMYTYSSVVDDTPLRRVSRDREVQVVDTNECTYTGDNPAYRHDCFGEGQICQNTIGSFECVCHSSDSVHYELVDGKCERVGGLHISLRDNECEIIRGHNVSLSMLPAQLLLHKRHGLQLVREKPYDGVKEEVLQVVLETYVSEIISGYKTACFDVAQHSFQEGVESVTHVDEEGHFLARRLQVQGTEDFERLLTWWNDTVIFDVELLVSFEGANDTYPLTVHTFRQVTMWKRLENWIVYHRVQLLTVLIPILILVAGRLARIAVLQNFVSGREWLQSRRKFFEREYDFYLQVTSLFTMTRQARAHQSNQVWYNVISSTTD